MNQEKTKKIIADLLADIPHRHIAKKRGTSPNTISKIRAMLIKSGAKIKKAKLGRPAIELPE